jgi:hypothetical protein
MILYTQPKKGSQTSLAMGYDIKIMYQEKS